MYKDKKVIHIVCMDELGGIGLNNQLLFNIPEDLQYFRNRTLGHSCLCGRRTYDSFTKMLSRRIIRYLSNKRYANSSSLTTSLYECWMDSKLLNTQSIYIIGGASIYDQTSDIADELLITIVDAKVEADTFYTIPEGFIKVWESDTQHSVNGLSFKFTKWEREVLNEVFK